MAKLIEMTHVTKVFGGSRWMQRSSGMTALDDFSMAVQAEPSSITAIVGESGSGKTTLARLLLGLATPTSGEVRYRGSNIRSLSRQQRRQYLQDVQVILQDPYEVYNPFYKVDHVLQTPIREFGLATSSGGAQALIEETLNAVGLRPEDTLGRHPHQLSGGQRQRIMVARALLLQPKLIIADEPVSMVDASLRATILESLRLLHTRFDISMLYITHDLATAYQISQNIIVLYRGEVAEAGDIRVVVRQPLHPYTQLLIDSIPSPDTTKTWKQERLAGNPLAAQPPPTKGCRFAHRCPHVMDMCRSHKPPLYRTEEGRVVACYLYRDQPELGPLGVEQVFARPEVTTTTPLATPLTATMP